MTLESISNKYLMDTHRELDFVPEREGKIIFLFFFSERDAYLSWLRTHNRREETIHTYRAQLNALEPYILDQLGYFRFDEIGPDEIFALIDSLGVCERSKKDYIDTFGRLVHFVTGKNPVKEAEILWNDTDPTHRIFIDNEDWPIIKAAARSSTDKLILALGAYLGLRREEMVRIKLSDFDDLERLSALTIHGKGHGKDGHVVVKAIPAPVRVALKRYLKDRERLKPETDKLLIRIDGKQPGKIMNGRSIRFAVDRMVQRSGIKFTPHSLRRLYATTMWEASNYDIEVTRRATRHKSVDVLMECYIKPNEKKQKIAEEKLCQML